MQLNLTTFFLEEVSKEYDTQEIFLSRKGL